MANENVDERIVEMQFDNQQFEKNANTTIGTLDKLKKSLNLEGAAKGFEEIDSASKGLDFSALQNSVTAIGDKFSMMGILGITAMQRISNAAIDMGLNLARTLTGLDGISEGFSRYAEKSNHVKTIMTATGASIEQVSDVLDDLNWFTDETSYRFTDMVNTMGKFTAAGVDLNTSKEAVEGIALWAAESGQNAQTASRAMFQLAQAYGRGAIQLQDWMSVEQANMSTQKIQNELIAEGGKAAEKAIAKYGGFRDSLRSGWLTTEIFNKVMQKYSEGVTEANYENGKFTGGVTDMSKAAFAAAQEARTYKDAIDSVKEAVSTGWSQSFELVFGNAEEAAVVWTDLANTLIAVSDKFTSFRNDILQVWNDIGGRDKVVQGAYSMLTGVGRIGNYIGKSFGSAIGFGKSLDKLKESEWATSYEARQLFEELDGLYEQMDRMKTNGDSVERLEEWQQKIDDVMLSLNNIDRAHALDNLSQKFENFGNKLKDVIHWREKLDETRKRIDELKTVMKDLGDGIENSARRAAIQETIDNLSASAIELTKFGDTADRFKLIWEGVLSVIAVGKEIFTGLKEGVTPILEVFSKLVGPIIRLAGSFGKLVKSVNDALIRSGLIKETFKSAGETLANFFAPIVDFIARKLDKLTGYITKAANDIEDGVSPLSGWFDKAKESVTKFFESFNIKLPKIGDGGSLLEKIGNVFTTFWETTGPVAEKISSVISNLWKVLTDIFGKIADFLSKFIKDIGTAVGTGDNIVQNIYDFIAAILQLWTLLSVKWTLDANPLEAFSDALYGLAYKFQGEAIKSAAQGLLYLAGALFVISAIDTDRLLAATIVMLVLMRAITKMIGSFMSLEPMARQVFEGDGSLFSTIKTGFLNFFSGIGPAFDKAVKLGQLAVIGRVIQQIGIAMLMLAGALFIIGQLKPEQMLGSVIVLAAIFKMLENFMKKTKDAAGFKTNGLIKMALSLVVIASAVKKLGNLEPAVLAKGLAAMGVVLLEIAGFQALIGKIGSDKGLTGIGFGMIFIAASMIVFAKAVEALGNLSVDELNQGLGALVALLAALTASMFVLQKVPVLGIAAGFLVLSFAIANIAAVMALLGRLKTGTLVKGLLAVVGAIGAIAFILGTLSDVGYGGMGLIASAAAIVIVAAALNLLVIPLVALGKMSFGQVIVALIALGGALAIIGFAATSLAPAIPAILGFAKAIALVGLGMTAIGIGLTLIGASLVTAVTSIMTSLTLIVAGLGALIVAFVYALAESEKAIALGIAIIGKALLDGLTMLIQPLVEFLVTLFTEVTGALVKYGPTIATNILNFLLFVMDMLGQDLPKVIDAALVLVERFIDGLARGIMDHSQGLVDSVSNLINSLIYFILTALQGIVRDIPVIGGQMSDGLEGMKKDVENSMREVGTSTGEEVNKGLESAKGDTKEGGKDLIGGVMEGANEALPELTGIGDSVKTYIGEGFSSSTEGSSFGADLLGGEKENMLAMTPEFSEVGDSITANIFSGDGVAEGSDLSLGANGVFDGIMDIFNSRTPEASSIGEDTVTNIATGMGDKQSDVDTKSQEVADGAEKPISELPEKFETHSTNAMQGIVNGVDGMWDTVVGRFESLAQTCDSKVSTVWQEHSPSRLFFRHSRNAMLGMANGVSNNSFIPVRAITNVANAMVDAVDTSMNSLNAGITPTIRPVIDLTAANGTVTSIGSMIAAQKSAALSASMEIESQVTQMDDLVDMTAQILGAIQNGSDVLIDGKIVAGYVNRRLGQA